MGDDLRIVNNARQSFGKESLELGEAEKGLISFLMHNRHGTPFEAVTFQFNVKCPIFVAREWFRHRIGSFNEFSARYSEMPREYYIPEPEDVRSQVGKPGSYTFKPITNGTQTWFRSELDATCGMAYIQYQNALKAGVAKELARCFLPVNFYTMFTWTVNLRSLFNFVSLRSAESAMLEIRCYSNAVEHEMKKIVPEAYNAFVENERVAP